MLTLQLPEELNSRLSALAEQSGRTTSDLVCEAVAEYVDDVEDLYVARQRSALRESGETQTVPLFEVNRSLGLER